MTCMKPVWIIDDDRSIRWVFEKAWRARTFRARPSVRPAMRLRELEPAARRRRCMVSDIRMPGDVRPGIAAGS